MKAICNALQNVVELMRLKVLNVDNGAQGINMGANVVPTQEYNSHLVDHTMVYVTHGSM